MSYGCGACLIRKYGDNKDRKTASTEVCYNGKGTWLLTIGNDHNAELFLYWTIHRETLVYKNVPLVLNKVLELIRKLINA